MCGIVGAAARRDIVPVLIEGLRRLEYRGYDSCGVAALGERAARARAQRGARRGPRRPDQQAEARSPKPASRTRAGRRTARRSRSNAHPMISRGEIALVHNGIIENYEELRAELKAKGYEFDSQTDTEVIDAPRAQPLRRRPVPGRAPRREAADRSLRHRRGGEEPAALRRRRARRQSAGGRRRQQRDVPRLGRAGARRHHGSHRVP